MPKITSDICKQAIVDYCYFPDNYKNIKQQFVLESDKDLEEFDITYKECLKVKNWKRFSKQRIFTAFWNRGFDCVPFDDQLRAYVITDEQDENILSVEVIGE